MRKIRLGRTNVQVPAVSLGTWGHGGPRVTESGDSVGWSGHDDRQAREALIAAWREGITHWDTADAYGDGHAEELIGAIWNEVPRQDIFLATKVGYVKGDAEHPYEAKHVRAQAERSLKNLKVETIDLYYLHNCEFGPDDRYFDGVLDVVQRLRDEGKIRFIGLSDWDAAKIMRYIERVDPDVVQPFRNVIDDAYASSGLKQYVDDHDLGVAFFSPLKHGLLLGKYEEPVVYPEGDFRSTIREFRSAEAIDRFRMAAAEMRRHFASEREPVLHALVGALLAGNPTSCVLLGQRNARQVAAAAAVGNALTDEEARWVRRIYLGGE